LYSFNAAAKKRKVVVDQGEDDDDEDEDDEDFVYASDPELKEDHDIVLEKSDDESEKKEDKEEVEEDAEGPSDKDSADLVIMTSKMKLDSVKQSSKIFCKGDIPAIVTTYDDKEGNNIAVVDVVCNSGTLDDQYRVEVSADRLIVELKYAVPPTFLHPSWLIAMDTKLNRHSARSGLQQGYWSFA